VCSVSVIQFSNLVIICIQNISSIQHVSGPLIINVFNLATLHHTRAVDNKMLLFSRIKKAKFDVSTYMIFKIKHFRMF